MDKENFKILKEIASLESLSSQLQEAMDKENSRILFVTDQRNSRLAYLQELTSKKEALENEFSELEEKSDKNLNELNRLESNLNNATTVKEQTALESQIEAKKSLQLQFEARSNEVIDQIDECEKQLDEAQEFEKGSLDSLNSLKQEVAEIVGQKQQEKDRLSHRIDLLLDEIPENFKASYKKVAAKKLKYGPFSSLKNLQCNVCGFKVSRTLEVDVEENFKLKTCPSCSRIFIPAQALY